jgi:hypothetical protein
MIKYLIPVGLGLSLLAAGPALSASKDGDLNVPRDQWLPLSEITEKLTALGYTVEEIESEDGAYEVEMVDKNGVRSEARIHPATAEILQSEKDDEDEDDDD